MKTTTEFGITLHHFGAADMEFINSVPAVAKVLSDARAYLSSGDYSKRLASAKYQKYLQAYYKAVDVVVARMGIDPKAARYSVSFGDLLS